MYLYRTRKKGVLKNEITFMIFVHLITNMKKDKRKNIFTLYNLHVSDHDKHSLYD